MQEFIIVGTLDYKTYKGDYGLHLLTVDTENGQLTKLDSHYDGFNYTYVADNGKRNKAYIVSERLDEAWIAAYSVDLMKKKLDLESKININAAGGVYIVMDKTGKFLIIPCWKSANVIVCSLKADGNLNKVEHILKMPEGHGKRRRQTQSNPHQIVFEQTGRYFAVPDLGSDAIHMVRFNKTTGKMELIQTEHVDAGDGPRHAVFAPNNNRLYVYTELDKAKY